MGAYTREKREGHRPPHAPLSLSRQNKNAPRPPRSPPRPPPRGAYTMVVLWCVGREEREWERRIERGAWESAKRKRRSEPGTLHSHPSFCFPRGRVRPRLSSCSSFSQRPRLIPFVPPLPAKNQKTSKTLSSTRLSKRRMYTNALLYQKIIFPFLSQPIARVANS